MYYKFLTDKGTGGFTDYMWPLPQGDQPGEWTPRVENLKMCKSGYHVTTKDTLIPFLQQHLYEVEVRGDSSSGKVKSCWSEARLIRKVETWNDSTQRLFMSDCLERVSSLYVRDAKDGLVFEVIDALRSYAAGTTSLASLIRYRNVAYASAIDIGVFSPLKRSALVAYACGAASTNFSDPYSVSGYCRAAEVFGRDETLNKIALKWQNDRILHYLGV